MTDFGALNYLKEHSSPLHVEVKSKLRQTGFAFEEYVELGEQYVNFYLPDFSTFLFLLEPEHDHTDSYYLEKQLQDGAAVKGAQITFVQSIKELNQFLKSYRDRIYKKNR